MPAFGSQPETKGDFMPFAEKIVLHLNRIIFVAVAAAIGALMANGFATAVVAGLVGWLAFVMLLIFKHPPMLR